MSPAPMIHASKTPPWDTGLHPAAKWPALPIPRSASASSQNAPAASRATPAAGTRPSGPRGEEPDDLALVGTVAPKQLLRRQKGTGRTASHKMRPLLRHPSQIQVTGEPPVIEFNIPRLQLRQLLAGQSHFAHRAGFQPSVPTHPVEHVIDHREASLRITGARGPMLIGGFFQPKVAPTTRCRADAPGNYRCPPGGVRASVGSGAPNHRSPARRSRD